MALAVAEAMRCQDGGLEFIPGMGGGFSRGMRTGRPDGLTSLTVEAQGNRMILG